MIVTTIIIVIIATIIINIALRMVGVAISRFSVDRRLSRWQC